MNVGLRHEMMQTVSSGLHHLGPYPLNSVQRNGELSRVRYF